MDELVWWTHNLVAEPLLAVTGSVHRFARWLHDVTAPPGEW